MRSLGFAMLTVLGLLVIVATEAQAQPYYQQRPLGAPQIGGVTGIGGATGIGGYRPAYQPAVAPVSPFLTLANGGNPAINYQNIVIPQIQTATALQQLQGQVTMTQDALVGGALPPVTTGHGVQFLNSSPYFMRPAVTTTPGSTTGLGGGGFGTLSGTAATIGTGAPGTYGRPYTRPTLPTYR